MGSDELDRIEDRLHWGDAAQVGAAEAHYYAQINEFAMVA